VSKEHNQMVAVYELMAGVMPLAHIKDNRYRRYVHSRAGAHVERVFIDVDLALYPLYEEDVE
jgi:hypothetical protein